MRPNANPGRHSYRARYRKSSRVRRGDVRRRGLEHEQVAILHEWLDDPACSDDRPDAALQRVVCWHCRRRCGERQQNVHDAGIDPLDQPDVILGLCDGPCVQTTLVRTNSPVRIKALSQRRRQCHDVRIRAVDRPASRNVQIVVRCGACEHRWALAFLPMPLDKAAAVVKRATCPACAETKSIFLSLSDAT